MKNILGSEVKAVEMVDTKDLYNTLTPQRNSVDWSFRGEVNVIKSYLKHNFK